MANKYTIQTLRDSTSDAIIKITGTFDGTSNELNVSRISANSLYGALDANNVPLGTYRSQSNTAKPYYDLQLTGISYFVNMTQGTGAVEVFWSGYGATAATAYANSATIFHLNMQGDYGNVAGSQLPAIPNNAPNITNNVSITTANTALGDIGIATQGVAANSAYTLIFALRKNNAYYQRGQFNDPAAFNFTPYNLTPNP
jgi:hypothetical protein